MSHRFVPHSSTMARTAKRALLGVALVAVGCLAALLASISVAILDGSGNGNASDAGAAPTLFAQRTPSGPAATSSVQRDFDYFPDHYTNQAREVAEQPPTF